jgi:hypothetical protein
MKKHFKILAGIIVTAIIATGCSTYAQTGNRGYYSDYGDGQPSDYDGYDDGYDNQGYQYSQQANQPPVGFNDFYNQLSPYGVWVNIAPYGQVWVANIPNFQPYSTNGYWANTTYGWTWVSNYAWGWAPFHYGRWGYNNRYGWYWVPGYNWGPAWVAWSSSADMYGWAPLMPGMSFGVRISIDLFPSSYWTFMPGRYMGNANIGNYYMNRSNNVTIIKNTTIINNYGRESNGRSRYSMGPSATDVQRQTGRSVQTMRVSNASDSRSVGVSNDEMRVYRPVSRTTNSDRTTSPANNNRATDTQTRTRTGQPATRTTDSQTRMRTEQPATETTAPRTRTQSSDQQVTRATDSQTRTRTNQSATRAIDSQTRTQSNQSATRGNTTRGATYQRNSAQPSVTQRTAPQTEKQIQSAQKDNQKAQQRSARSSSSPRR